MPSKRSFVPIVVFSVFANVLMLVAPLHMMQVYDRVLSSGSQQTLFYITLIAAVALVLFGVCEAIRTRLAQRMSTQYVIDRADPLFASATASGVSTNTSHDMLRNHNTVRQFIASRAFISLFDLPFAPVFLLLLFLLHFQIGLITLIGASALIIIALINKKSVAKDQEQASVTNSNAVNFASAVISRGEDIKAMGLLPQLMERWGTMTGASLNAQDASTSTSAIFLGISRSTRHILQVLIMAWGAFLVLNGDLSGGMIFAASMISGRALQPIEQFIGGWENLNRAKTSHEAIENFVQTSSDVLTPVTQPAPNGHLRLNDVSLEINGAKILDKISLNLPAGEFLGVVGPSGAGKSTLIRLIAGAVQPTSGEITLDNCEQKNWPVSQWGQYVGYVAQDVLLFPATIAENIARMAVHPQDNRVISAAKAAGVHDLINSLQDGYMTNIGEGGFRLSGGQLQRISLARALYSSPRLLVLDEPNAHLDQAGEAALLNTINILRRNKVTIIAVTQHGKLLDNADRIITLKNGVQTGLHVNRPIAPMAKARQSVPQNQSGFSEQPASA